MIEQQADTLEALMIEFVKIVPAKRNPLFMMIPKANHERMVEITEPFRGETSLGEDAELMVMKYMLRVHVCLSDGYHLTKHEFRTMVEMFELVAKRLRRKAEDAPFDALRKAVENMKL